MSFQPTSNRVSSPVTWRVSLVALATFGLSFSQQSQSAELIWAGDFEEGNSSINGANTSDFKKKIEREGQMADVDVRQNGEMGICTAAREGQFAGRARILQGGSGTKVRGEIKTHLPGVFKFDWDGPEYWVGISLCLAEYPNGSDVHTFLQIHAPNEPDGSNCDFAGNALTIAPAKDNGQIRFIDNPSGRSDGTGARSNSKSVYSYNLRNTLGEWQDFVFRFRLSTRGDGYYTVWHNGNQVATETGLVNVNWKDSCNRPIPTTHSNGLHLGIYGGPNTAGPKTLFIDSVKIAEGTNGFDLVTPGNATAARPAPPTGLSASSP